MKATIEIELEQGDVRKILAEHFTGLIGMKGGELPEIRFRTNSGSDAAFACISITLPPEKLVKR